MLLLQSAVSAGFVCGFGVFECRVNQLYPSIRLVANDKSRRCLARAHDDDWGRCVVGGRWEWKWVDVDAVWWSHLFL